METPIVFIIFNRPDFTEKVFEIIRRVRPSQLFVIADGPRSNNSEDINLCKSTRQIIDQVDWDCNVFTNYSDINLGCKKRISSGLDWVFNHDGIDRAIILEEDCLVDLTFFDFCCELLEKYKNNPKIMSICAANFQFGQKRGNASYYLSVYHDCWGWATWKRAWKKNDITMSLWPQIKKTNFLKEILPSQKAVRYWYRVFNLSYENKTKSWFYPWLFSCWVNKGLAIIPNVNLVSNIGYDERATNTNSGLNTYGNLKTKSIDFPLVHLNYVHPDLDADNFTQSIRFYRSFSQRVKERFAKALKSIQHQVNS